VSETLKHIIKTDDTSQAQLQNMVGRMGGDEFVVLLQAGDSVEQPEKIANDIVKALSQPMQLKQSEVEIGASIGVSHYPQDGKGLTELLKFADIAMYRAKHSGRNQVVFYQPEMIRRIEYCRGIQTDLRKALKEELLTLNYQPIYNCQTREIIAVEAILNLEHCQSFHTLEQAELFSIADESQVSILLGEWMFEEALEFMRCQKESDVQASLVVPVRPTHFHQKGFVDWLSELLENHEFPPENLVLSLNEGCLNAQRFPVEKQLKQIAKLGVEVAVQRFGSGNLSPLRLHDWPIDHLHLSSLFVTEITNKRSMESMAMALIQMGHTLNKKVVAYGVRSAEQQAFLISQHCYLMQGPFLNEPMNAVDMESMLISGVEDQETISYLEDYDEY